MNGTPGPGDRRNGLVNVRRLVKSREHEAERTSTRLFWRRELEHGPDALMPESRRCNRCRGSTRQVETLDWEQRSGFRFQTNATEAFTEAANQRDQVATEIITLSVVYLEGSQRGGEDRRCRWAAVNEGTSRQA